MAHSFCFDQGPISYGLLTRSLSSLPRFNPGLLLRSVTEIQAGAFVRLRPEVRIASLRFHMCRSSYETACPDAEAKDLWGWVSYAAAAKACMLGLTSTGWSGHEVFNIVAPNICWEGFRRHPEQKRSLCEGATDGMGSSLKRTLPLDREADDGAKADPTSLELLAEQWPGTRIKPGWWDEMHAYRGFWDTSKAERLLGWVHEE